MDAPVDPMWVMRACNMRGLTVSMNGVEALARQLRYERASARLQVLGQVLDKAAELLERDQGAFRVGGACMPGVGAGGWRVLGGWVGARATLAAGRDGDPARPSGGQGPPHYHPRSHTLPFAAAATLARSRYQPAHH